MRVCLIKMVKKIYLISCSILIILAILIIILSRGNKIGETNLQNNSSNTVIKNLTFDELFNLTESQCENYNYSWVGIPCPSPGKCNSHCDIPTSDSDKTCYSNSECEGACLCSQTVRDDGGFLIGKCSKYKYFTDVRDCPCVLTNKSKTRDNSYGCA